jgi:transketolase
MRNTIINVILEAARKNPDIILMTADLGYSVMEKFIEELPGQFINAGIAEQNMIGLAAGLALSGKKVFVYTIAPFATMRCFEQIRVDLCYHNLDVTVIGVGGGFAYGTLGNTHYALEDIAIMRSLPEMKVMCPSDPTEARMVAEFAMKLGGPSYIRLNRGGEQDISGVNLGDIRFGDPIRVCGQETGKIALLVCGNILSEAYQAALDLLKEGVSLELYSVPFIKPVNADKILDILDNKDNIFTIEEHNIIGGLGSMIAEIMAESSCKARLVRLGIPDKYFSFIGKQDFMRDHAEISAAKIKETIRKYV